LISHANFKDYFQLSAICKRDSCCIREKRMCTVFISGPKLSISRVFGFWRHKRYTDAAALPEPTMIFSIKVWTPGSSTLAKRAWRCWQACWASRWVFSSSTNTKKLSRKGRKWPIKNKSALWTRCVWNAKYEFQMLSSQQLVFGYDVISSFFYAFSATVG